MWIRYLSVALAIWCTTALAGSGTAAGGWQVTELRLNTPTTGGAWYGAASPLSRGLNVNSGYIALYAVEVLPGLDYTVQLTAPHGLNGIHVSIYDRWPLLLKAHAVPLPTGPVVVTPHARQVTYRWRVGVSPRSTGSLLYVLVQYPRDPVRRRAFAPRLLVASPPIESSHHVGRGVTYLPGPRQLVLYGDRVPVAYVFHPAASDGPSRPRPAWTMPGDLVSNGRFAGGLKNWVPLNINSAQKARPAVDAAGLALPSGTGVRQQLDTDVSDAESLILWTDVRLDGAAEDALDHGRPGFAVVLCYQDEQGEHHCGDRAYRVDFYTESGKGRDSPLKSDVSGTQQRVPAGRWVRYQTDLLDIDPPPARIDSVALRGGLGAQHARVREVHIILRGKDHGEP